jgi:hypothetical protein
MLALTGLRELLTQLHDLLAIGPKEPKGLINIALDVFIRIAGAGVKLTQNDKQNTRD